MENRNSIKLWKHVKVIEPAWYQHVHTIYPEDNWCDKCSLHPNPG